MQDWQPYLRRDNWTTRITRITPGCDSWIFWDMADVAKGKGAGGNHIQTVSSLSSPFDFQLSLSVQPLVQLYFQSPTTKKDA